MKKWQHGGELEAGRRAWHFPVSLPSLCLIGIHRCFIMQKPLTFEFSIVLSQAAPAQGAGGRYASSPPNQLLFVHTRLIAGSQPGSAGN